MNENLRQKTQKVIENITEVAQTGKLPDKETLDIVKEVNEELKNLLKPVEKKINIFIQKEPEIRNKIETGLEQIALVGGEILQELLKKGKEQAKEIKERLEEKGEEIEDKIEDRIEETKKQLIEKTKHLESRISKIKKK